MKRVLMFSYYFPPMGGAEVQRVFRFARHLPEFGWQPIVVTTNAKGHTGQDESLLEMLPPEVVVERIPTVVHPSELIASVYRDCSLAKWQEFRTSNRLVHRLLRKLSALDRKHLCFPDPMNWWAWRARIHVARLVRKHQPDVLWATGYPWSTLWLLAKATKKAGIPAIGDVRDPWSWHPQGFWASPRHKTAEASVFREFFHLVVVTEGVRRQYSSLYPDMGERITVIRNGFEAEDQQPPKDGPQFLRWNYLGSLSASNPKGLKGRSLFTFAQALQQVRKRGLPGAREIRVTVAGNGVARSQSVFDELGLTACVVIKGSLPLGEARALRTAADVLIVVMGDGVGSGTFVPLKVYEYLAANRPILALLPEGSEAGEIICRARRGVVCRVDDVEDIAKGITRILTGDFDYDPGSDISEFSCWNSTRQLTHRLETAVCTRSTHGVDF